MFKRTSKIGGKLFLFIICPFVAFLESFQNPQKHASRIIIFLWFVVWGMCFVAQNEEADSFRVVERFYIESNYSVQRYVGVVKKFFTFQDIYVKDLYTLSANVLIGSFTHNYHWLFLLYAIVFGFFYVKSMKFVLPKEGQTFYKWVFPILFLLFCYSNPIFNINGVRFWTADWISVYSLFRIFVCDDKRFLWALPLLLLIHTAYIILIFVVLLYYVSRDFHQLWKVLFIISLFFSAISFTSVLESYEDSLPPLLQMYLSEYTSEEAIEAREMLREALPLYTKVLNKFPVIILNVLAAICIFNREQYGQHNASERVLDFVVILLSFVNLTSSFPSIGRFMSLMVPFLVYLLINNHKLSNKYSYLIYCIPIAYAYSIYQWGRHMLSVSDINTYFMPLPYLIGHNLF